MGVAFEEQWGDGSADEAGESRVPEGRHVPRRKPDEAPTIAVRKFDLEHRFGPDRAQDGLVTIRF